MIPRDDTPPSLEEQQKLLADPAGDGDELVEVGRRIGAQALNEFLREFGGCKIHVPRPVSFWRKLRRWRRDREIRARFRGNNMAELVAAYRLSERQIRNIVQTRRRLVARRSERTRPVQASESTFAKLEAHARATGLSLRAALDHLLEGSRELADR